MISLVFITAFIPWNVHAENKAKRTLSQELHNYGEPNPMYMYNDNIGAYIPTGTPNLYLGPKSSTFINIPQPVKNYDQINSKVLNPPMLYEYYQTATNVVPTKQTLHPNNNLNHYLSAPHIYPTIYQEPVSAPNTVHSHMPSETSFFSNKQNPFYENGEALSFNNKLPILHRPQQFAKNYIYPNGKIIFDQTQSPYIYQNINEPQIKGGLGFTNQQIRYYHHPQRIEKPTEIDYFNRNHFTRPVFEQKTVPSNSYKSINPNKRQSRPVNFTQKMLLKNEESRQESTTSKPIKEKEEAEVTSEDIIEEDDYLDNHEQNPDFSKYTFDYEENNKHELDDEDDENENKRQFSKYGNFKKNSQELLKKEKPNSKDKKKTRGTTNKYERLEGKLKKKNNKQPKIYYKSVKYSGEVDDNPEIDFLEGKHSEHVPITHKHKFFKEKWYITKNENSTKST